MSVTAQSREAHFLSCLERLERPLLREWSVKAFGARLVAGRWIVSAPRAALGPGPSRALRRMLGAAGAPPGGIARLDADQRRAVSVHFGFEPDPAAVILKCYLEFGPGNEPRPGLRFLALKWRASGDGWGLSSYTDRTDLALAERRALLDAVAPDGAARDVVIALLDDAPQGSLLEVTEEGAPRRSLDLNLADLGARVGDRHPLLLRFLGAGAEAEAHLAAAAGDRLGHVAIGRGRDGTPFATLYHGARRVLGAL